MLLRGEQFEWCYLSLSLKMHRFKFAGHNYVVERKLHGHQIEYVARELLGCAVIIWGCHYFAILGLF